MLIKEFGSTKAWAAPARRLSDYYVMTKPGVVRLLVFTAIVGMLLATPGAVPWHILVFGALGIGLAASSGAVVNHVLDERIDAQMSRTRDRPMPMGRVGQVEALVFAFVLGGIGLGLLAAIVNPLTAGLTFASLIGYAVIYTVYLKRATPQNIVIGGAAGAAPPMLGWAAVNNEVGTEAFVLFLIIFTWTPPHFWALAVARKADYERAGVPMLPVTHGIEHTKSFVLYYTILLGIVSVLPWVIGMSGVLYVLGAASLGAGFLYYAVKLKYFSDERTAMQTFAYSISYLMALFSFLLVDHYIPVLWPE